MLTNASTLINYKDMLVTWIGRIIRSRYQQSVLGGLWIVVQPLATVAIVSVIFTYFVPIDTGDTPYIVFSYVALVPWMLLANSLPDMTQSLVTNMHLVNKIYFPREILPLAALLARFLDFFVAFSLLFVMMLLFQISVEPLLLLYLPVVLLVQLILILGIGLLLSAAYVFFRDVGPLLTLGIQIWFYACPIIYPASLVPERLQPFYYWNPMAGILQTYRDILLEGTAPGIYFYQAAGLALLLLAVGYWSFKRVEFRFADIV